MGDHLNDRMKLLSDKVIPLACKDLSDKNTHIAQVIQYLENNYLSSAHTAGEEELAALDKQAKTYVVDILSSIATDIESLATNLNTCVGLQTDAIDSIGNQMNVIKQRLVIAKTSVGLERFDEMRCPREVRSTAGLLSTHPPAVPESDDVSLASHNKQLPDNETLDIDNPSSFAETRYRVSAKERVPMDQRLARLDDVGICLKREPARKTVAGKTTANPLATDTEAVRMSISSIQVSLVPPAGLSK